MGRLPNCSCRCNPPYPDCFGCVVFESPEGNIADVDLSIGSYLDWDVPEESSCSVPFSVAESSGYSHEGAHAVDFLSVPISSFSGALTLQRSPFGTCVWRKRSVKRVQSVFHDARTTYNGPPTYGVYSAYPPARSDSITYPYTDPVDSNDQWSPVVYAAADPLAYTVFCTAGEWTAATKDPRYVWWPVACYLQNVLELKITRLAPYTVSSADPWPACYDGVLLPDPNGTPYWELSLYTQRLWSVTSSWEVTGERPGFESLIGTIYGQCQPFCLLPFGTWRTGYNSYFADPRLWSPAGSLDLASCPPYYWSARGTFARNTLSQDPMPGTVASYANPILRWVKQVDCTNDFLGYPIDLTQTFPLPSVDWMCAQLSNYDVCAEKFGMTGHNATVSVELQYV